jgi:ubiquinone/menaquinone biosynthesis C-methylase UbiE
VSLLSVLIRRRRIARTVVDAARLDPADRVIDIGCGPGSAVRGAARRVAAATGIDPDPAMLRAARRISTISRRHNIAWLEGQAEKLPLPAAQATVVWAISSVHHWADRAAGFAEASRVLFPAGRLLIVEQLATGENGRGISPDQVGQLRGQLTAAGFGDVSLAIVSAGRRTLAIISGTSPPAGRDEEAASPRLADELSRRSGCVRRFAGQPVGWTGRGQAT